MNQQMISILYIVGLFALLYFLMIRPQQTRQKKHQEMVRGIKVNDKVVTAGGMFATVVKVKEDSFVLRIADNVRVEFLKNSIAQVRESGGEEEKE